MNNTLLNGLRVLDFLAESAEALSIKEVAEHFQLPNSHICRLLKSLVETGYAEQLPGSRKYRVSLKILHLVNARLRKEQLLNIARPYLRQLAEKVDAAVFVTKVYCGYSLIIGTEYPALFSEIDGTVVGTLHSPTDSACGRVCAAYSSCEVRTDLLAAVDWDLPGDFQGRRGAFEEELDRIRCQGYALRDIPGVVAAVGVPLFEAGGVLNGALGVMLPPRRGLNPDVWPAVIEAASSCGKLISGVQGCSSGEYPDYQYISKEVK